MLDIEEKDKKSKSQVKRDLLALQMLGRELVELSSKALDKIPISASFHASILDAKQMKRVALKRQLKHIGGLMRDEDTEAIRMALVKLRQPHKQDVKVLHEAEAWRDGLLAGDDGLLNELGQRFVEFDHQHVRQLIRNAKKEQVLNKPPKSARSLFRHLKELSQHLPVSIENE